MQHLTDQLEQRLAAVCAGTPDADRHAVAALLVDQTDIGPFLDDAFASFSQRTRDLVAAHGRWPAWSPHAAQLIDVRPEEVALARAELANAAWLPFPLPVRAWRRARLTPADDLLQRAADAAEQAFHHLRYAGAADTAARAQLDAWTTWDPAPEVAQWGAIAREEALDDPCERCRPWAALEQSRAARWRGWDEQSARFLKEAEATATSHQARFMVAFLRTMRAVQRGASDREEQVATLAEQVTDEGERFFVHQVQAVLAQSLGRDPRPALNRNVHLAQRMGLAFREAITRLLLAHAAWPDGAAMKGQLELMDLSQATLTPRDHWNVHWAWARAHLADEEVAEAAVHARRMLEHHTDVQQGTASAWGVIALAEAAAGSPDEAQQALRKARRFTAGATGEELLAWVERVMAGGTYHPTPRLGWASPTSAGWVTRDGHHFQVGNAEPIDLSRSPVGAAVLRALANGPQGTNSLIDAVWPDDASSYPSLKNRLHATVRVLRKRGLEPHLRFVDGAYRLDGLDVVEPIDAADPHR